MKLTPARVASLLAGAATLLGALAPAVANMDVTSAAGIAAGIIGVITLADRFLVGQRAHEARIAAVPSVSGSFVPSAIYPTTTGNFAGPSPVLAPVDEHEPGDAFDGLPHHAVADPAGIPADMVDIPFDHEIRGSA